MNKYIEASLKIDLAQVITALAEELIDVTDLWQVITDPPTNEEDLMDFIDRDDIQQLYFVIKTVKSLTKHLDPMLMVSLRKQLVVLQEENECDTCGGTLLISCTCEC